MTTVISIIVAVGLVGSIAYFSVKDEGGLLDTKEKMERFEEEHPKQPW